MFEAVAIVTSEHLDLNTVFVVSHFLIAKEWMNGGETQFSGRTQITNNVNIFSEPSFVSPDWRCYLNKYVLRERFHCILSKMAY